jgi:hypothetical protein
VADPNETVGKISMLNEFFPLSWAPRAGFMVQGLVQSLPQRSLQMVLRAFTFNPWRVIVTPRQTAIRFYCRVSCMKEPAPIINHLSSQTRHLSFQTRHL